jgi:uncharacterized protein (DUF2267 family)
MAIEAIRSAAQAFRRATDIDSGRVFLAQIEQSGSVPEGARPEEVAAAVFCTLARRLSLGESRNLISALPPDIQSTLRPCAAHDREWAAPFGRDEFLREVTSHFEEFPYDPEELVRVVFRAVHSHIGRKHIAAVASQLPGDLKVLWEAP